MKESDVRSIIMELNNCSNQKFRNMVYSNGRNLIKECDEALSRYVFGNNTIFRFCKRYTLESLEAAKERLGRTFDIYRLLQSENAPVISSIKELSRFTSEYIVTEEGQNDYKSVVKSFLKDMSLSFKEQLQRSFLLSIYVNVDNRIKYPMIRQYTSLFAQESKEKPDLVDRETNYDLELEIAHRVEGYVSNPFISKVLPPAASTFSSTQRMKKYDGEVFLQCCDLGDIHPEAKKFLTNCLKAIRVFYGSDVSHSLELLESMKEDTSSLNFLEFLPRLNFVPQSRGKVARPVFIGCDYADMALHPFMILIKQMMTAFPSNFSRGSLNNHSMYTRVRACSDAWKRGVELDWHYEYHQGRSPEKVIDQIMKSDMSDVDSSSATDRLSGLAQWSSFYHVWRNINDEWKLKTGISEEYLSIVKDLLLETPYIYELDGEYYMAYSYGTSQGLKGSWDLLNWNTMYNISGGYCDYLLDHGIRNYPKLAMRALDKSCHNGDDGAYSSDIDEYVKQRLRENALPGIVSEDKSASESEIGALIFSSSYVRTYQTPRLSNLRLISLVCAMSDPYVYRGYVLDKYMNQQLMLMKKQWDTLIPALSTTFNVIKLPLYLDIKEMERAAEYSVASKITRYEIYKQEKITDFRDPLPGTNISGDRDITPSVRCKNVAVVDSAITSTRYEILVSGKAAEECFNMEANIVNQSIDEISEQAYSYVKEGIVPKLTDPYYDRVFRTYLRNNFSCNQAVVDTTYQFTEQEFEKYTFVYEGYAPDDQVISAKFKFWNGGRQ